MLDMTGITTVQYCQDSYLFDFAPAAGGARSLVSAHSLHHFGSGEGGDVGGVGMNPGLRRSHGRDHGLDHPLQVRARRDGRDGGHEGGRA